MFPIYFTIFIFPYISNFSTTPQNNPLIIMIPKAKADATHQGWENTEFPIVCENCLGDSAYVRMTKESAGGACKTCDRPFTIFRWKPGPKARFKKTEVCQLCARVKNVCQTCILDLNYGAYNKEGFFF